MVIETAPRIVQEVAELYLVGGENNSVMDCHCHCFTLFPRHLFFGDEILGEMDALTQHSCSWKQKTVTF